MTKAQAIITYEIVGFRETAKIALMIATLNDLEVKPADILNAYIQAPETEKVWTILGTEFGSDASKTEMIVRILCGSKSAGAAFKSHLTRCMKSMGYDWCMTLYIFTMMQSVYSSAYISLSCLNWGMANQKYILVQNYI